MTIRAIETLSKGYRFRSRLEARWAVFFDALGVPYEYELQGYALPGGNFLPDFWLPDLNLWVEIKPEDPDSHELMLAADLGYATDRAVVIVSGTPGQECLRFFAADSTDSSGGEGWWDGEYRDFVRPGVTPWICGPSSSPHGAFRKDKRFAVCSGNDWSSRVFSSPDGKSRPRIEIARNCLHDHDSALRLFNAYASARSARFEHGEEPR